MNDTLEWVKSQELSTGGLAAWPGQKAYPEVTGYMIPTLIKYGEVELALRLAKWLVSIQNKDGSFNGIDGIARTFDTGACFEGLLCAYQYDPELFGAPASNAQNWLMKRLYVNRFSDIPGEEHYSSSYTIRVNGLLKIKCEPPASYASMRVHYWMYALEGMFLLGERAWVRKELEKLPRGLMPYALDNLSNGADISATFQCAILRMKCGLEAHKEMHAGLRHKNGRGYFPHDPGSSKITLWTQKFALDAMLLYENFKSEVVVPGEHEFSDVHIRRGKEFPFGISGCFRVCNDHEFLYQAVASHLPYIDEAVIALQPSNDETEEAVALLLKDFPDKVRVYRYPVAPVFITDKKWEETPENSVTSFVYLSNWALGLCKYSWIARIEADVICLSPFKKIVEAIRHEPTANRLYGRVILNVAGKDRDMISSDNPRNGGWDECVFPNKPEFQFIKKPKYEVLSHPATVETICMGWSALHMKRCKADKIGWNNETYAVFDKKFVPLVLEGFNKNNPYPGNDNPLGVPELFELNPL